eukprot:622955-Pyramimonas_sp.AAC.1
MSQEDEKMQRKARRWRVTGTFRGDNRACMSSDGHRNNAAATRARPMEPGVKHHPERQRRARTGQGLSLIHISEPTRPEPI